MKMYRLFVFVVVALIFFISVSSLFTQTPPPYGAPISLEMAKKIAAAAFAEAKKNNVSIAVVITDGGGWIVYVERMDGIINAAVDVAIMKARSAAAFRNSTKAFADQLAQGGLGNRFLALPHAMPVEGGLPIIIGGKVVGAIGVSGATAAVEGQIATEALSIIK